jgi:hypothetical protein
LAASVKYTLPSWSAVMPLGWASAVGTVNDVTLPFAGLRRPIRLLCVR